MVRKRSCQKYPEASVEIHVPQLFCPVCSFWENVRRRVRAGEDRAEIRGEAAGGLAQPLKAGQWRSSVYRPELDLGAEGTKAMDTILIEAPGDE